jgi:hypothetical protein
MAARKGISDRTMPAEQTEKTGTAAVEGLPLTSGYHELGGPRLDHSWEKYS